MTEPIGGALYIRRRYRALFLDFRNYHNRITVKNIAGVTPRGVVYTLRSVLRGLDILNAHFTGVNIPQRECFSVCLPFMAVVGHESRTGRCKHPRFSFCS